MPNLLRVACTTMLPLALGATPAPAQQATPTVPQLVEIEQDDLVVRPFNLTVDQIEDMDLVDASGAEIGDIEELLADSSGQVAAVTVEAGGFLGIGEREAVVGIDQIRLIDDRLVTELTKEQIEQLPTWDD